MNILAFESSCDETSVAIVSRLDDGSFKIKSNIVSSQIDIHRLYGGVVPEIASRAHIEAISSITYEAFNEAGLTLSDIDLVAVTANPGLIGALLVGVNFAKGLAAANSIPLVAVVGALILLHPYIPLFFNNVGFIYLIVAFVKSDVMLENLPTYIFSLILGSLILNLGCSVIINKFTAYAQKKAAKAAQAVKSK